MKNRFMNVLLLTALSLLASQAQATGLSDYLENRLIDSLTRAQTYTPPATTYWGLATTTATDVACGTEVAAAGYARVAVTSSLANWAGTQSAGSTVASTGTNGTTSNNNAITFGAPTANWGSVTDVCGYDAGQTTVNGAITSGVTTMVVTSAATFPGSGAYDVQVESEIMTVTAGQGTTSWTVTRGARGSTAAAHANAVVVSGMLLYRNALTTAKTINNGDAAPSFSTGTLTIQIDN